MRPLHENLHTHTYTRKRYTWYTCTGRYAFREQNRSSAHFRFVAVCLKNGTALPCCCADLFVSWQLFCGRKFQAKHGNGGSRRKNRRIVDTAAGSRLNGLINSRLKKDRLAQNDSVELIENNLITFAIFLIDRDSDERAREKKIAGRAIYSMSRSIIMFPLICAFHFSRCSETVNISPVREHRDK